ncbi:S-layer homology domain-containing protein [Paenibacillus sinopodophylli]|uniref:S-layer homology domain-containing protein n=1 Tax=Paenibacillus sinopodophylli TaxID=1837342 RepID=UPI001FE9F9B7|nr:S-layer homology domain-containing protein [Paenibacillus sinopodophylli]
MLFKAKKSSFIIVCTVLLAMVINLMFSNVMINKVYAAQLNKFQVLTNMNDWVDRTVGLPGGRIGLVYYLNNGTEIWYKVVNADGSLVFNLKLFTIPNSNYRYVVFPIETNNGDTIIVYTEDQNTGNAYAELKYLVVSKTGLASSAVSLATSTYMGYPLDVTKLSNGGVAVAYSLTGFTYNLNFYDANMGLVKTVNYADNLGQSEKIDFVKGSNDDRLMLVRRAATNNYIAELYDNSGNKIKDVTSGANLRFAALSNGNFAIAFGSLSATMSLNIYDRSGNQVGSTVSLGGPFTAISANVTFPQPMLLTKKEGGFVLFDFNSSTKKARVKEYSNGGTVDNDWYLVDSDSSTEYGYTPYIGYENGYGVYNDITGNMVVYSSGTLATPISDFASSGQTSTTASFSWTAVTGATAIIIEKSPAGTNTWTTATTGAIAANASTATVTGLNAGTSYDFRLVVTGGTKAGNSNTVSAATTGLPVLGGTVAINGTAKYGEQLTANLVGVTYTPTVVSDVPTYEWKRDGVAISLATTANYTLTQADIGKVISVTLTADGTHATGIVTSVGTSAVAKADGPAAPNAPTLSSKTTTSLTLQAEAGQEYSLDNGTWQDSPTFSSLTANTDYNVKTRVKATATREASAASVGATLRTESLPVMGGTVVIDGTAKYGEQLTANVSGLTYTPTVAGDVPTYQWKRDGVAISLATNANYTLTQADIGAAISVTVTAGGTHATGSVTSTETTEVAKADGPATPNAPTLSSKTTTSLTLQTVAGQEYSLDNGTWQDSPTFNSLMANTDYTVKTRVKATATREASAASVGATLRTESLSVLGGTVVINGTAKYGEQLTANVSGLTYTPTVAGDVPTYQWKRDGVAISLATSPNYTLTQADIGAAISVTVTAGGTHATGSVTSTETAEVAKADGPTAPNAPTLSSKTTTSLTLQTEVGQEYSLDNGTWQDSPTFNSLMANTDYTLKTRVKATATHEASAVSVGATLRTESLSVLGGTVVINGTAKYGEQLTVNVSGLTYTPTVAGDVPTYQWKRDGVAISLATSANYTLTQADIGAAISVTVTAGGTHATGSVTSTETTEVTKADGPVAPNAPTLSSKTMTSLTLQTEAGQEYSLNNGTWQDSPTFNSLTANTDYTVKTRVKATATREASAASIGATLRTESLPVLGGTVTISGTTKYGEQLTANVSGLTYTPTVAGDVPTYQWKRDGVAISLATSANYTLTQADIGAAISVTVTAGGTYATGSVTSSETTEVAKADGSAAPNAPTLSSKTTTSLTLQTEAGQEYSLDGLAWQDSPTFINLTPNTDYTVKTRVKATATREASAASVGATLRTESLPVIGGTVAISGEAKYGEQLTADVSGITYTPTVVGDVPTYQWKRDGVAISLATNANYTLTQADIGAAISVTVTAGGTQATGSVTSTETTEVAKADGPAAPNAPTLSSKTTTSLSLQAEAEQEYSLDGLAWQDSPMFSSLTPNTDYIVKTRMKATATHEASAASVGATLRTESLPEIGGTVAISGEAKYGEQLTADVSGITYTPTVVGDVPTYQWKRDGVAINSATNANYTLTQADIGTVISVTITAGGTHATGNVTSSSTAEVAKADGPAAPSAPVLSTKTTTSLKLQAEAGQEYSLDGALWQDNTTFSGLTPNTDYTLKTRVKATATREASAASVGATLRTNDVSSPTTPVTTSPSTIGVDVLVNGKVESAGTAIVTEANGQKVITISVDEKKLDARLAEEGQGAVITIPVNIDSNVYVGELNGQMVKKLENKQATIEIKTKNASYKVPALEINVDALFTQFGANVNLQDMKVRIEIAEPTAAMTLVVNKAATAGDFAVTIPSLNFKVTASYGDKTVEVTKFNSYVERTFAIPAGVDSNRITTGIVVDPDGTTRHVPTKVRLIDGKYYASIKSLTNSTYTVVWHPIAFKDVEQHWAKDAVNDMGSRMILEGTGEGLFNPDRKITRAEFAAIIVRGLGLRLEAGNVPFSDVKTSDWYSSAVNTAYSYDLISGYGDGTFLPNTYITREQAMMIIAKAMKITELKDKLAAKSVDEIILPYKDAANASDWALNSIADCLQSGIVSGMPGARLAPKQDITRAEVALIIQRLLQKSDLI